MTVTARPGAPTSALRVAIVDDATAIRLGLPLLLPQLQFRGAFADTESLLIESPDVDVVLLDLNLEGAGRRSPRNRASAVRALTDHGYRVCVYSQERRRHLLVGALLAGASGIVHKSDPEDTLPVALARIVGGEIVITQSLVGLVELADRRDALPTLSTRQRQVLAGRARGETFRSIAGRLYISEATADEYMREVKAKFADFLRTHSAADLERLLGLEDGDLDDWSAKSPFG